MVGRIRTSCNCWQRDKKLAIPAEWASTKRVIRLCRRSRAAMRRRERGLLVPFRRTNGDGQQHERNARDMAWSKARAGGLLCSDSSGTHASSPQHSTSPLLHYSIPHKIPCNLSRRFPLYGVEAGGLPVKSAQRKEANVDKDPKLSI